MRSDGERVGHDPSMKGVDSDNLTRHTNAPVNDAHYEYGRQGETPTR